MGFNGNNDDFLHWFTESVKLFHELTADLTDEARRKLILDPGQLFSYQKSLDRSFNRIHFILFRRDHIEPYLVNFLCLKAVMRMQRTKLLLLQLILN